LHKYIDASFKLLLKPVCFETVYQIELKKPKIYFTCN